MALNLECLGSQSAATLGMTGGIPWCELRPVLDVAGSELTVNLVRIGVQLQNGSLILAEVLEHVFVVVFGLELVYRLYRVRCEYFRDYWNWLDATLVLIAASWFRFRSRSPFWKWTCGVVSLAQMNSLLHLRLCGLHEKFSVF